jgi:hypothetical protein
MSMQLSTQSSETPLVRHVRAGKVYRREDLVPYSTNVDRELHKLVAQGMLQKLSQGMYYKPRKNVFGEVPPSESDLLAVFLKDKNFLSFNPSVYNSLRLGTTQLYNKTIVYNHKRHGMFELDQRLYDFRLKPRFPKPFQVTTEYLLVDMLNNLSDLAEDEEQVLLRAQEKLSQFDAKKLNKALMDFGSAATKRRVNAWLSQGSASFES